MPAIVSIQILPAVGVSTTRSPERRSAITTESRSCVQATWSVFTNPLPGAAGCCTRESAVTDLADEAPDIGLHVLRLRVSMPEQGDHLVDARVAECSPDPGGRPREQTQAQ